MNKEWIDKQVMTDFEILFKQFKNLIPVLRCKEYIDYMHKRFPDKELHHLTGSFGPLKLHDAFVIPFTREQHQNAHNGNIEKVFIDNIAIAIKYFFEFLVSTGRISQ